MTAVAHRCYHLLCISRYTPWDGPKSLQPHSSTNRPRKLVQCDCHASNDEANRSSADLKQPLYIMEALPPTFNIVDYDQLQLIYRFLRLIEPDPPHSTPRQKEGLCYIVVVGLLDDSADTLCIMYTLASIYNPVNEISTTKHHSYLRVYIGSPSLTAAVIIGLSLPRTIAGRPVFVFVERTPSAMDDP